MKISKDNQAKLNQAGLATRRAVLGSDYVDAAVDNTGDFTLDMQIMTTEVCWDRIWNRPHELKVHIRGAITNGLTKDEIKEVFL